MGITFSRADPTTPDIQEVVNTNGNGNGSLHNTETPRLRISDTMKLPNYHVRQGSLRSKQPLPDPSEVETQFAKLLASMDLPPDKAKLLRTYDLEKKWDLICDQEMVVAKDPPSHYLNKIRTYLDPKASRSHRKRKMVGESTSTQVLRDLEISLRTNNIEWVKEFLSEEVQGLDVLIDYLSFRLSMMRHEQRIEEAKTESMERMNGSTQALSLDKSNGYLRPALGQLLDSPNSKRRSKHVAKLNMGATTDDIHVCIMCLRAIMNNKHGFNLMIQHREAINSIALSLIHKSLRTKALVLELLAAICLVNGGHTIILSAFDNFKRVCDENRRFQTLMDYFMNFSDFHIDFLIACMQFVNIVVHSVEDMNYRVHLQYEFTTLGLDDYLVKLRHSESEELQVQISAYLDNMFDVASLMEDSETKSAALERVNELEDDLSRTIDRLGIVEQEMLFKIGDRDAEIARLRLERDELLGKLQMYEDEVANLKQFIKKLEQDSKNRESMLIEMENLQKTLPKGTSFAEITKMFSEGKLSGTGGMTNGVATKEATTAPAPPPPAPPATFVAPPPPPPLMNGPKPPPAPMCGPPPPAPPMFGGPGDTKTIKRSIQTTYKLPTLNWVALKPNQVRGTIFNELDDDKLHKCIDFRDFEERFKLGGGLMNGGSAVDGPLPGTMARKEVKHSLLENNRLRNLAILRRKLDMPVERTIQAINTFDLKNLSLENVELLQKMVPTEQEAKLFRQYIIDKKDVNLLTDEDKFLLQLTRVERLNSKLTMMSYIGNFFESINVIGQQVYSVISASNSLKTSSKFKAVLEIILAFGNYMNSSKRGHAYGFKLQSLDTLCDTKSSDKRQSLLHYVVQTIRSKFPQLMDFDAELTSVEKASQVTLESVVTDFTEMEKGMEMVKKEVAAVKGNIPHNPVLKDFLANNEEKFNKMRQQAKTAQDAFKDCVEYFGESRKNTDANAFFTLIVRFIKEFKTCDQDNEKRLRIEQAALQQQEANNAKENEVNLRTKHQSQKRQDLINELQAVQVQRRIIPQDQVNHGTFEDLLVQLKAEPYRRADAVRRSHRKHLDSNRYSRTLEEMSF